MNFINPNQLNNALMEKYYRKSGLEVLDICKANNKHIFSGIYEEDFSDPDNLMVTNIKDFSYSNGFYRTNNLSDTDKTCSFKIGEIYTSITLESIVIDNLELYFRIGFIDSANYFNDTNSDGEDFKYFIKTYNSNSPEFYNLLVNKTNFISNATISLVLSGTKYTVDLKDFINPSGNFRSLIDDNFFSNAASSESDYTSNNLDLILTFERSNFDLCVSDIQYACGIVKKVQ